MKRRIRPAEEEIGNVGFSFLFTILWYAGLAASIRSGGFILTHLLFLAAGLIPIYTMITMIRRAFFYRKQREDAIAYGHSQLGRIQSVMRQDVPYYSGKHHTLRYHRYYYLDVELTDPVTGVTNVIRSQGYRRPIHRYLASDTVRVYTDRSGWKHYLEEFQFKAHRNDPGAFDDRPMDFEETAAGSGRFVQILFAVIVILMILNLFSGWGH